jgi:hypothetical protein
VGESLEDMASEYRMFNMTATWVWAALAKERWHSFCLNEVYKKYTFQSQ